MYDEQIDPVDYAVHRLEDDVCELHELHAAGKGYRLQQEFKPLHDAYIRLGDFVAFLRNTYHVEAAE